MLFVPGDQPRKVTKALGGLPADAVILDLEDAIANSAKVGTRALVAEVVGQSHASGMREPRLYVRVNGVQTPWFFGDLDAVVQPGLDGIMLPKTPSAEALYLADRYLAHLEHGRGLASNAIELMPLIESASGAADLAGICTRAPERVRRIGFGATDYTVDIGATWTAEEAETLWVRTQMVLHSRLAELAPPIDTVYPHFREAEVYATLCRRSKALGFGGRMCIHPDQLAPTNQLYAPTEEERAWAAAVIQAFEQAEAQGVGALQVNGQLVDYAFVARARQIMQAG